MAAMGQVHARTRRDRSDVAHTGSLPPAVDSDRLGEELIVATEKNSVDDVKRLIARGADINKKDSVSERL